MRSVEYITYLAILMLVFMAITEFCDHQLALVKTLKTWDQGEVHEDPSWFVMSSIARFLAKRAFLVMFVFSRVRNAAVDTAVIFDRFDTG